MKPGEIINKEGFIELNKTSNSIKIKVSKIQFTDLKYLNFKVRKTNMYVP